MYREEGQRCEKCRPGISKTKCTYCHKVKIYLKDHPLTDVPSSHWLGRGLTDEYIKEVTDFLRAMKVATLMLRSPDEVERYHMEFLQHNKTQLRHEEALVPHWQQFTNALESYDGIFDEKQLYHSYRRCCFRLAGIELHSSVIDMLGPALATCITSLSLHDVGRGWIDLAIGVISANSSLKYMSCSANPSRMERVFDLFSSVADHPTLSELTLRKVCSDRAEGNSLFVLAKICLLDGNSGSTKAYRLDFSGNSMSSRVATHIADVIASNSLRLVKFNLTDNQLADTDAQAIGQALRNNETLERLCVQGNEFTQVGVAAIRDAVISPGCTFQAVLNSEQVSIDLPYSIGKLCPDFRRKYCYNDELTDVAEIERRKICYIFASRHGSGTNYQLLCEELGDPTAKLLPFAIKRVFDCSYKYFAGNYSAGKLDWPFLPNLPAQSRHLDPCNEEDENHSTQHQLADLAANMPKEVAICLTTTLSPMLDLT
ncbi:hypothetical protein THAOC_26830 [Thalassiosira oceanica]|uniref:Uncharacterized protein n=1 Tax=Thalassiosira oceanica TaxID=159749 RepID=K0RN87_THAOC|nr:hypothetical protein THAOC_26830 [Thalassiosira oceanica]|eukprot:EJK53679.1 hypothetical protein THAOC_26830 [Thalassiosira oceanica]